MGFDEITNILYLLLQGMGVGIAASITVGPVAVLCIQRTLSKSRRSGFASGLGVACADTLMAIFAMLFSSILQRSIEANRLILSVVSGIIVVIVGVYIFLQNPVTQIRRNRVGKTTLWRDFASMFGITLTNFIYVIPYIMIFFTMFKVSTLGVTDVGSLFGGLLTIAGFLGGAVTWWFALTFLLNLFRHRFRPRHMLTINHVAGIVIAIDGFSSCGKSTFAKAIARRLGYIFIDTGAMYRAVTLYALEHGAIRSGMVDEEAVVRLLPDICIDFRFNPERGASDIYVDGDRVEGKIRTIEVSNCVSAVSSICEVRAKLVAMQQQMGRRRGVVMDGRDIGTTVFPDAELKIFMTARPSVRARRRYDELRAKGDEVSYEEILQNVLSRDKADMTRAISPLRKADDAVVLDNSCMTVAEQMEWFEKEFRRAIGDGR
ncbi:(d)CMP kinase [Alistipes communis]|uniref:(d)CMP kinase n=1 Tax=Alistipes communis TaxID=2585118 RepID=UPI003A838C68